MIKTVMIIDDETHVLSALQRMLVRSGWQVITFVNPLDALEFARHRIIPLVITDFRMPKMTGTQFLQSLEEIKQRLAQQQFGMRFGLLWRRFS